MARCAVGVHASRRDRASRSLREPSASERLARQVLRSPPEMTDREAKTRAVKILAKSLYRDLEAQGFDEKQIVAFATELISEVTSKMAQSDKAQRLA